MISTTGTILTLGQAEKVGGGFVRWLLGLKQIDPSDPTVMLSWRYDLPLWLWVIIIAAIGLIAATSYKRLTGRLGGRVSLAVVRAGLLLVLAALLAGPKLLLPKEQVEPDHVLMLLDRSVSMTVADAPGGSGESSAKITRDEQLRRLIKQNAPLWEQMSQKHNVDWLAFSDHITELGSVEELPEATGRATAIRSAINESLRWASGKPISTVMIFSDGRSSEPIDATTRRRLHEMGLAVYVVPLGSPDAPLDYLLQRVDAPAKAFVNDVVPITVIVGRVGAESTTSAAAPAGTIVRLIDTATKAVLDEKPVKRMGDPIRLKTSPDAAGPVNWRVELVTNQHELISENNRQVLQLTLVDRPIRLLYIEGSPRWEYRYLKNMMIREKSIKCSVMLTSADRTFAQEGDVPLRRLPRSTEEIKPFDVVVIGDVPSDFFSGKQVNLLHEQVSLRGSGLMWIGGERFTPNSYVAGALAPMLPMSASSETSQLPAPVELQPTPIAEALGVLQLRSSKTSLAEAAWPPSLPALMWAQRLGTLKPASESLAIDKRSGLPLIVRMRYGAGQTMYVATDESWRWRYGRGELYFEQYWMQLIRLLARQRLQTEAGRSARAQLVVSTRRATVGDTLVVELKLLDQTLVDHQPKTVEISVGDATGRRGTAEQRLTLTPTVRRGYFRGLYVGRIAGKRKISVITPTLTNLGLQKIVEIQASDDEMRWPATDHPLLKRLAEQTGGRVVEPTKLADWAAGVPNRTRRTAADIIEPLTHSPLAFVVLLLLLTGEWVGRKLISLV